MANTMNPVLSHHTSQERQPAAVPELQNDQPHQPPKQSHAEEQAGFRAGRSTTEQIFNLRILCEKYLQHQQDLCHVLIDLKKAFDRVWQTALCAIMKKYKTSTNFIRVVKNLYAKATSSVRFNSSIGDWLRTTVGVRQGCLLSPTLF